jgi:hypothetical protein
MPTNKIGGALFAGNSELLDGPLGVVQVGFKGYDLGKTTEDTSIVPDQDIKDIMYQQEGTKAADHVRTGIDYLLNVTFGEIKTQLLTLLMKGITSSNALTTDDTGVIGREIYQSMLENEAGGLRVVAVDSNGTPSELDEDIFNFYSAIPIVNADLVNWGADSQRGFTVQFRIKWHRFSAGESSTFVGGFGYWGTPTDEDVPAIVWPDVEAPEIVSATATAATTLAVVFDENIAFQTAYAIPEYVVKVEGEYILSTAGVIATTTLTLTFPALTFTAGDVIEISISENALEDTAATANLFAGVDAYPVTNSV